MKKLILIGSLALSALQLSAQQLTNYDKDGNKLKTVADYVVINMENTPTNKTPVAPTSFVGVILGPVYNIVSEAIKKGLDKRQKSFTATYANSTEFSKADYNVQGEKSLFIKRYAINTLGDIDEKNLAAAYELKLLPDSNNLSIQLKTVNLERAKARYKKDDNLSIAINIKASSTTLSSKKDADSNAEVVESKTTDAEGTIIIPIFKLNGTPQDFSELTNIINKIKLKGISFSTASSIKLTVNITETNITRIEPSQVQNIITGNSADIQSVLKAIFGVTEK